MRSERGRTYQGIEPLPRKEEKRADGNFRLAMTRLSAIPIYYIITNVCNTHRSADHRVAFLFSSSRFSSSSTKNTRTSFGTRFHQSNAFEPLRKPSIRRIKLNRTTIARNSDVSRRLDAFGQGNEILIALTNAHGRGQYPRSQ